MGQTDVEQRLVAFRHYLGATAPAPAKPQCWADTLAMDGVSQCILQLDQLAFHMVWLHFSCSFLKGAKLGLYLMLLLKLTDLSGKQLPCGEIPHQSHLSSLTALRSELARAGRAQPVLPALPCPTCIPAPGGRYLTQRTGREASHRARELGRDSTALARCSLAQTNKVFIFSVVAEYLIKPQYASVFIFSTLVPNIAKPQAYTALT